MGGDSDRPRRRRPAVVHRRARCPPAPGPGRPHRPQAPPAARGRRARSSTLPGVRTDGAVPESRGERGSSLPFVLVCWTVAALMAFGAVAASDAFLEQQEVQSICDGAALAAADRADEAVVYSAGVGAELPLTRATAQAAVADQLADGGTALHSWSAETDGAEVTVRCTRYVDIAFGWLFLGGEPLERTATASARAPTLP